MAWMKASGWVWMPGLGGISTRPWPFSLKAASSRWMMVGMSRADTFDVGARKIEKWVCGHGNLRLGGSWGADTQVCPYDWVVSVWASVV